MKIIWLDTNNKCSAFKKTKHSNQIFKFLYWKEEEIILASPYSKERTFHKEIHNKALGFVPSKIPDGAGEALKGKITRWTSIGYGIITPIKIRQKISKALGIKDK